MWARLGQGRKTDPRKFTSLCKGKGELFQSRARQLLVRILAESGLVIGSSQGIDGRIAAGDLFIGEASIGENGGSIGSA